MPLPYLEDDEDELLSPPILPRKPLPTPDMNRLAGQPAPLPISDAPVVRDVGNADANYAKVLGQKPVPDKPKWWQRVLAGAAGFGAGYVNAEGKTHVDPTGAIAAIYDVPGYQRKMADWERSAMGAEAEKQAAEKNLNQWWKNRQVSAEEDLRQSQMAAAQAREERENRLANKPETTKSGNDVYERQPNGEWKKVITGETQQQKYNLQKTWVQRPGSDKPEEAFVDPRNPGRILSLSGEELPAGTQSVSQSVMAQTARAQMYGEFGNYYRAALGQGHPEEDARRIAGDMVMKKYGVGIGRAEQDMAIKGELSGIGGSTVGPQAPRTTQVPAAAPAAPGAGQATAPMAAPRPRMPLEFNDKERSYVNQFIGQLLGTLPAGRGGMAGQVGVKRGMDLIASRTGVDPMTLQANLAQDKATSKQLAETVQRAGAIQRLNNTIDLHGKVLEGVAQSVQDSGSPLFNRPIREWGRAAAGSPEYKRFQIAINAVQREYAYLTAGGAQSRAMLPVTTSQAMEHMISPDATLAEVKAAVDQIRIEAGQETAAMRKTQDDLIQSLRTGMAGRAVSGGNAQSQQQSSGTVRMRAPNGQESDVPASQVDHFKQLGAVVVQ